jgi:hypothetical protein
MKQPIRSFDTWTLLKHSTDQILCEWSLQIQAEDILRMQASDPEILEGRSPLLLQIARDAEKEAESLVKPQVISQSFKVQRYLHERFELSNGATLRGELLAEHLAPAEWILVAVCTIGQSVEQFARDQFPLNPPLALALEGYGSAAVEALATEFCALVERKAAEKGLGTTIPLSPGMLGWPVEQGQPQIFDLLDTSLIGVHLTESAMMLPVKSISFVLGIGSALDKSGSTCDYCSMREHCHYRDHYLDVKTN